ncbi:hypothetical protein [Spirosoma koreense]
MKLFVLLTWLSLLVIGQVSGQNRPYTKLYLGSPASDLRTTLDPSTPLNVGAKNRAGYTLLETDLDSLGLILANNKTVFLKLEPGKTYYYYNLFGGYRDISENAFWLTVSTFTGGRYRHYILSQKSGITQVDD